MSRPLFTLGLAACGSDGGSDPVATPDPTPAANAGTPILLTWSGRPSPAALAAAMDAVAAVNDASTDEMVAAAEMAVANAMTAIDGATHISAAGR